MDTQILEFLKNTYKMSQSSALITLEGMNAHPDIKAEFWSTARGEQPAHPISVEGYTAQKLLEERRLSHVGAYNYLIYLREEPEQALKDLEEGLPVL